jgi:hypothetical protein
LPSVGGAVPMPASTFLDNPSILQIERSKGLNRFCVDQDFLNSMVRSPNVNWQQNYLEYILMTGANWSGPMREFRLVVDKGAPENLLSFCGQGVRKISPTQFEVRASNFVPSANISLLILKPERADPAAARDADGSQNLAEQPCDQLWQQRNSIFKGGGYCFRTPRAHCRLWQCGMQIRQHPRRSAVGPGPAVGQRHPADRADQGLSAIAIIATCANCGFCPAAAPAKLRSPK